uniref:Uncharacterized protein n=1 Tax=Hyaloperonospora arabidopsidis (strain Emoy2) TaxID=559515 RepID=M4BQR5_HYAAE
MRPSEASGRPSSPVVLNPFDEGSSKDSEVVRATLAKSGSSSLRPSKVPKPSALAPPDNSTGYPAVKSPTQPASHPVAASAAASTT